MHLNVWAGTCVCVYASAWLHVLQELCSCVSSETCLEQLQCGVCVCVLTQGHCVCPSECEWRIKCVVAHGACSLLI